MLGARSSTSRLRHKMSYKKNLNLSRGSFTRLKYRNTDMYVADFSRFVKFLKEFAKDRAEHDKFLQSGQVIQILHIKEQKRFLYFCMRI